MRRLTLGLVFSLVAVSARAQSAYVSGTVGADVSRVGRTESNISQTFSADTEVFSWSLRLGTAVGQNWGVETEFVRSARSKSDIPVGVPIIFSGVPLPTTTALPNIPTPVAFETVQDLAVLPLPFPTAVQQQRGKCQNSDVTSQNRAG